MPTVPLDWSAYGGGAGDTVVGTGVLVLMLLAILLTFLLPRKHVFAPLMFGLLLFPIGQTFVLGGVHLYVTRILILAGLIRCVVLGWAQRPLLPFGYCTIDKVFTVWTLFRAAAFVLLNGEMAAAVNQMGFLWDAFGCYFLMRLLIRDNADVYRAIKWLGGIAVVLGLTLLYEKFRGENLYSLIAGYTIEPEIREGAIRAQGPFHHAILAGTFGATLLPLFFWLWRSGKSKWLGLAGMGASTAIAFSAASSTPASAYLAAVLAIAFWPMREKMRLVRWGAVVGILVLNFAMHSPVWWALSHVDIAGGSAGHHRAELIDNFVRHFSDWWLIGTKDNAKWGFLMEDISNQYVAEGETGGLVSFICLVTVITLCFKKLGRCRKRVRGDRNSEWYFWLLGCAWFSHTIAFVGISYFDQTRFAWYALLAMIIAATPSLAKPGTERRSKGPAAREILQVAPLESEPVLSPTLRHKL